jgi:alpha-2-macroglobulin
VRVRVDGNGFHVDRRYDLPVRPAWPSVVRSRAETIAAGASARMDAGFADGLMADSVTARMVVTAVPPIPFASALQGALDYPYGCVEQTTSRGFAALELDADTAKLLGTKGLGDAERRKRMEGAFGRLAALQIASGHFSMWGDGDYVSLAITPYVAEFLLDAREAGFAVPEQLLQKALNVLSEDLLSGGGTFYGRDHAEHLKFAYQAHAGYVLARVNRAPLGTLRALYDNERRKSLTGLPLVHLGLALSLQGDKARGRRAIDAGFAHDPAKRPEYLGDYGSRLRDEALMVALLHEHGLAQPAHDARVIDIGRELDARRRSAWLWLSTQEQIALARLGKALMADARKRVSGEWRVGDKATPVADVRLSGRSFDHAALARGVTFGAAQGPLYASLEIAGVPREAPAADASQVEATRSYYRTDGSEWTGGTLEEGEALIVKVAIRARRPMPDALLTELLPAGLEVENFNLGDAKQWAGVVIDGIAIADRDEAAKVRHEEFRDDRYVAALNLSPYDIARVFYLVRAVTPGTYTVPPSLVEDMYRPDVRGVGKTRPAMITVREPGQ